MNKSDFYAQPNTPPLKIETKICNKCKRELPISNFGSDAQKFDGKSWWCKDCLHKAEKERYALKQQGRSKVLQKFSSEMLVRELQCRGALTVKI